MMAASEGFVLFSRCETCKHWEGPDVRTGWGECALTWSSPRNIHAGPPGTKATAEPMESGCDAVLVTAPDFGCVQWEAEE